MSENIKNMIGKVFKDIADAMETGQFGQKVRVGITVLGSEHGVENIVRGAELAQKRNSSVEVVLIGPKVDTELKIYEANTEDEQHKIGKFLHSIVDLITVNERELNKLKELKKSYLKDMFV